MENEKRLIDVSELIKEINDAISDIAFTSPYQNDIATMVSGMERVLDMVEDASTVDAVEVEDPELLKAIKLLIKQYDHSKASEYVHSPVAHALYHTWKQVDKGR